MNKHPVFELIEVMARLRSPKGGCPWDLEQNHGSIRFYCVEEAYELIDAIEAGDDHEMVEELGDLLLQVIFHAQMAAERGAFDFAQVCRREVDKLVTRHPHVFGDKKVHTAEAVLAQWEHLKRAEKKGTRYERPSVLDGIPKRLPSLLRAEKLLKKARKAKLLPAPPRKRGKEDFGKAIFELVEAAQAQGRSAEALLRAEIRKRERQLRRRERVGSRE
jgi:XTP/dITP diphosphohydrolase